MRLSDWVKFHYYKFKIEHDLVIAEIKVKLLEMSLKAPIWGGIQYLFWRVGGDYYSNVHFFTSVYDVLDHFLPRDVALIIQAGVYYLLFDPVIDVLGALVFQSK